MKLLTDLEIEKRLTDFPDWVCQRKKKKAASRSDSDALIKLFKT